MLICSGTSVPDLGDRCRSDVAHAATRATHPMTSVYTPRIRLIRKIPEMPNFPGDIEIRYAVAGLRPSAIASAPRR
jgi:hypothetical protein